MDWGLNLPTTTRPRSMEDGGNLCSQSEQPIHSEGAHQGDIEPRLIHQEDLFVSEDTMYGGWAHPNISNVSVIFSPLDRQDSRWIDLQGEGNGIPAASLSHVPTDNVQTCISSLSDTKGPDEVLQLSMLVAKINETINNLHRSSCGTINNASDLDDYPIGSVLQLSRDFLRILRGIQRTELFLSPDLNGNMANLRSSQQQSPDETFSSTSRASQTRFNANALTSADAKSLGLTGVKGIGVSSELLIISCYISLTNLCSIVLDHFERYIRLQSEAGSNRWTTVVEPFQTPDILLRELPGAGETWSKTCTAIHLLLDALRSTAEAIGISDFLNEIRLSGPDDSAIMSQEQDSEACADVIGEFVHSVLKIGLFQKVESLKQLLRARMNL
ncbi:hypothetical protein CNMCM5623_007519 [Aspergillus felis]|uniref:Uncharacterized protein n=1 Tax=Aspergillus felis TaxID=1287682 RepID=A0A8H6V8H3_9EURO|nr:hypothetical protein CNMCM5623_007519 [Aspergillus felis]KAF7181527.1 hypothetical protein CNMCM7691_000746 [Aspergillus felis]